MKEKYTLSNGLFTILSITLVFFIGFNGRKKFDLPNEFYRVYLHGEVIGVITSEEDLVNMINDEQSELKKKYNVDKVHLPKGLEIQREVTYSGRLDNVKDVYEKIIETENFTIEGYQVSIKEEDGKNNKTVYMLNKDHFDVAVENVALAFVDAEKYAKYMNNEQEKITDVGEFIENIEIGQDVTIKPSYISTNETIFTTPEELTRYLLFGTLQTQKIYKIKSGDTIESVAEKNKLSVDEFIIANPEIKSKDVLLYPGQEVNIALINPMLDIVVLSERTTIQTVNYSTKIQYSYDIAANSSVVKQNGVKGKSKVTFKVETINGVDASVVKMNTVVLSAPVTKIIVRGYGVGGSYVNSDGDWGWPTNSGYSITSNVGYRWGTYHYGMDIAGTGYGSPIYAAADGVVYDAGYSSAAGYYVNIDHQNGYYTRSFHFSKAPLVKKGDKVTKGQKIGTMGNTGDVWPRPSKYNPTAGTHLHFEVWVGGKPHQGGRVINPLALY